MCNTAYNLRALWLFYNDTFAVTAYTHNNLSLKSGEASAPPAPPLPPLPLPTPCIIQSSSKSMIGSYLMYVPLWMAFT